MNTVQIARKAIDSPVRQDGRIYCGSCKKLFKPSRTNQKFCETGCRLRVKEAKRKVDQDAKSLKIPFFQALGRQLQRAGTAECLYGLTDYELLKDTYLIWQMNQRRKDDEGNTWHLSHLAPVAGATSIGLFRADNLISLPACLNLSHGNQHFGGGVSRSRKMLSPKNEVRKGLTQAQATMQAVEYIGKDNALKLVRECKLKPSLHKELTAWIVQNYQGDNPVHCLALPVILQVVDCLPVLSSMELSIIKQYMEGKRGKGDYETPVGCGGCDPTEERFALTQELERFSKYRPELGPFAYALSDALMAQVEYNVSLFTKPHAQTLADVLHGKGTAHLEALTAENTLYGYLRFAGGRWLHSSDCSPETFRFMTGGNAPLPSRITSLADYRELFPTPAPAIREPVVLSTLTFDDFNAIVPGAVIVPIQIAHHDPYDNYSSPF